MTQVLEFNLDDIFEGALVPQWLRRFAADSAPALDDLLVGRASLGALDADEPSSVLIDWLEGLGGSFAKAVDVALSESIGRAWGEWQLPQANRSASVTSVVWCRVCDIIAMTEALDESAAQLREKVLGDRPFLEGLHEGRSRDPAGRAWLALARHQPDRKLIDDWWRLCSLPPNEAWYRGAYGIHGLRGLPDREGESGNFPTEVAEGLALLGASLAKRSKLGSPTAETAKGEFLRTCRLTMAAYPYQKIWREFWRNVAPRSNNPPPEDWIKAWQGTAAGRSVSGGSAKRTADRWLLPDFEWKKRAEQLAIALRRQDLSMLADSQDLLDEQAEYAVRTGDSRGVVRNVCLLANAIRPVRPLVALEWFELGRRFEPWNERCWTGTTAALVAGNRANDALPMAVEAVTRFSDNVFALAALGDVLKSLFRFPESEEVFRAAVARFPDKVHAWKGLGKLLKSQRNFLEAEGVFRRSIARFPNDSVVQILLGEVLQAQKRYPEAEDVFRTAVDRFSENVFGWNGLGKVLGAQRKIDEAEGVFREAITRFHDEARLKTSLAELLWAQKRYTDAEGVLRDALKQSPNNVYVLVNLARVLAIVDPRHHDDAVRLLERANREEPRDHFIREMIRQWLQRLRESNESVNVDTEMELEMASAEEAEWSVGEGNDPIGLAKSAERSVIALSGRGTDGNSPEAHSVSVKIPSEARILLTDSYLLRRWSRRSGLDATPEAQGEIQRQGKELLERLLPLWERNVQIAGESGLLAIAEGDLVAALNLLREAVKRFPGSSWVRYALARAERALAHKEQRRLSDEAERQVIAPWRALSRTSEQFTPVQNIGEGRAWLSLVDGSTVENHARTSFGKLAHWVRHFIQPVDSVTTQEHSVEQLLKRFEPLPQTDSFVGWWAREVQIYVFGGDDITRAEDINADKLAAIRARLDANHETLDTLEEDFVRRYSRA